jgi:hypothetical protein
MFRTVRAIFHIVIILFLLDKNDIYNQYCIFQQFDRIV